MQCLGTFSQTKHGYINAQNYRLWKSENPHAYLETGLHPQKIGLWCTVSRARVVGTFFFKMKINAERYQKIVEFFVVSLEPHERNYWF